ncbi:MAG: ABC transporter permease [Clostridia bacterium]|nr:ABC transporter permease [Clostridia bacterium]
MQKQIQDVAAVQKQQQKQLQKAQGYDVVITYLTAPKRWWLYTLILLIVVVMLSWSGTTVKFKGMTSKGSEIAAGIWNGLVHPDMNLLINTTTEGVPYQLLQTVAIAVLGTLIGGILAIPFSFLACDKVVPKGIAFIFNVFILLIRTIPSLVWALVWIRVTGPNAFCGVVTQSICSIGMICKMYITAIEDIDTRILESLDASGCNGFQKVRYGILPQIIPNFISTVIYRFDINVKDATTLGIVGAGGIGAALIQCITSSRWSMVGSYLFGMIVLMIIIELFSTQVRKKLARG